MISEKEVSDTAEENAFFLVAETKLAWVSNGVTG